MAPSYKLTKVTITNYKGIASQAFSVGPGGAILAGPNGAGKTSARDAVVAALASKGVDPSCIREGADSSEILVNLEGATVRRRITTSGATATVTNSEGDKWGKPQSRLDAIFGSMLDPLKFFLADKKEQRRLILEACPVDAPTAEDFARWLGEFAGETLPDIDGLSGLEAVEKVRKAYYDRRAAANADVKTKAAYLATAQHNAKAAHDAIPSGVTILPLEKAKAARDATESARVALIARGNQAEEQARKTAGTRERIAGLRAEVERLENESQNGPTPAMLSEQANVVKEAAVVVADLKRKLEEAEDWLDTTKKELQKMEKQDADAHAANREAIRIRAQADELEASLSAVAIEPVTPEQLAEADAADTAAGAAYGWAMLGEKMAAAELAHSFAIEAHAAAKAQAEALDKVVDALTNIAPRELMTRSNGIPGLALTEDGITLDGRNIANLCGAEKMAFAVDVAKRANSGGGKLLCVDGLEALDEKNRVRFIELATADGWQLLGTLVSGEDLHVIELQ